MVDLIPSTKEIFYSSTLPSMTVERKSPYRYLGEGSEGMVFLSPKDDSIAFKVFNPIYSPHRLKKKFQKIEVLSQLEDPNFAFPKGFVKIKKHGSTVGYYMDYVKSDIIYDDFRSLDFLRDFKKVLEVIKKIDDAVQRVHMMGITLGDIRGKNILLDQDFNPVFIDTDNFAYMDHPYNIVPWRSKVLSEHFNQEYSQIDNDKLLLATLLIEKLVSNGEILTTRRISIPQMRSIIARLDVCSEVKEALYLTFSDAHDKPYLGEYIESIDPNFQKLHI